MIVAPTPPDTRLKWRWDVDSYFEAAGVPYCTEWWGTTNLKDWYLKFEIYNTNFIAVDKTNAYEFFIRRMRFTNILGKVQYSDWTRNTK